LSYDITLPRRHYYFFAFHYATDYYGMPFITHADTLLLFAAYYAVIAAVFTADVTYIR